MKAAPMSTPHAAGPRVLEHIVDVVLYMEGDGQSPVRLVRVPGHLRLNLPHSGLGVSTGKRVLCLCPVSLPWFPWQATPSRPACL